MKQPSHIMTLDLAPLGATTLYELRDTLVAEFEANKNSECSFAEMAAVSAGVALNKLDKFLQENDLRRPSSK